MDRKLTCPCCSGKTYQECCSLYHLGKQAENALALMRSRYSAYALNNVDYIIRTTHPRHPSLSQNRDLWKQEILNFALNTDFERLEIVDFKEMPDRAIVIFIAHLKLNDEDVSFTERSYFAKVDGSWLYVNGDIYPGENRDLTIEKHP